MITIFSAPKPFTDPQIANIQGNAIQSWTQLGDDVEVLLLGDEPGIEQAAQQHKTRWIGHLDRAPSGAPIVRSIFDEAIRATSNPILCYVNADIILLSDFIASVQSVAKELSSYLVVGERWDLAIPGAYSFELEGEKGLRDILVEAGRRHPPMGSDYFVFPSTQLGKLPEFALGRAGWDNWMIYNARHQGIPVVDASEVLTAIHQDHDYAHLAGGQPHYRHAESRANVVAAGGVETIFRLRDADWKLTSRGLQEKTLNDWEWPRKIEADLIARVGPGRNAKAVRMAFHPVEAIRYFLHRVKVVRGISGKCSNHGEDREQR